MKIRWIIGLLAAIVLAGTVSATGENVFIINDARGMPGDSVQIPLRMAAVNVGSMDGTFCGAGNVVPFDIISVEKGSLTKDTLFESSKKTAPLAGCYGFSFASSKPVTGTGTIAIVTVKVKDTAKAGSTNRFIASGTNYDNNGKEIYNLQSSGNFTITPAVRGDGDHDGKVTSNDALAALHIAVGTAPQNLAYDMDGNGYVRANDVQEILKLSVAPVSATNIGLNVMETLK